MVRLRLPGTLSLHGVARPIEFPVEARWDRATIQVAGGTRVRRADFGLEVPNLIGYRIEDTGVVELELPLVRKGAAPAWSPDGTCLSFVRDGNLHITRPDGPGSACVRTGMLLTSGARWRPSP